MKIYNLLFLVRVVKFNNFSSYENKRYYPEIIIELRLHSWLYYCLKFAGSISQLHERKRDKNSHNLHEDWNWSRTFRKTRIRKTIGALSFLGYRPPLPCHNLDNWSSIISRIHVPHIQILEAIVSSCLLPLRPPSWLVNIKS